MSEAFPSWASGSLPPYSVQSSTGRRLHGELESCTRQGVLQVPSKRFLDGFRVIRFLRHASGK